MFFSGLVLVFISPCVHRTHTQIFTLIHLQRHEYSKDGVSACTLTKHEYLKDCLIAVMLPLLNLSIYYNNEYLTMLKDELIACIIPRQHFLEQ